MRRKPFERVFTTPDENAERLSAIRAARLARQARHRTIRERRRAWLSLRPIEAKYGGNTGDAVDDGTKMTIEQAPRSLTRVKPERLLARDGSETNSVIPFGAELQETRT